MCARESLRVVEWARSVGLQALDRGLHWLCGGRAQGRPVRGRGADVRSRPIRKLRAAACGLALVAGVSLPMAGGVAAVAAPAPGAAVQADAAAAAKKVPA